MRKDTEMELPQRHGDTELRRINPITERIIGSAIEVHRVLRGGLLESLYQSALAIEFDVAGLSYRREVRLPALYKGRSIGVFRLDFIVEDSVVLKVKSVDRMDPVFDAQLITYLRLSHKRVGLLLNFNSVFLKQGIRRRVL